MSNPGDGDATPITSVRQLAEYIAAGCKPRAQWRIGTEHEKFGFRLEDRRPPPYEPADGQPGCIRDLLRGLQRPRRHADSRPRQHHRPGPGRRRGVAGARRPAGTVRRAAGDAARHAGRSWTAHFDQVRAVSRDLRLGWSLLGFHPTATRADMPWMPKGRYAIMRRYMPTVGQLGLDMMTRTCTVQVNLDYGPEADMARKLRLSLLLQPLATALFANSPFVEGRPSGFLSYRAQVWTDTDNARSGIPSGDVRGRLRIRTLRRMADRIRCRCTSSIATDAISTSPAPASATSCRGACRSLPASRRRWAISPIT